MWSPPILGSCSWAYDTLGEVFVVFAACIGVFIHSWGEPARKTKEVPEKDMWPNVHSLDTPSSPADW